jgi:glycosyltransferase involved in cell wall biosynthesis
MKDAANTGYPDNHFDTVIIPELIEHIKDPHRIISEALRVVKPGGLVLVSVPDGPDPNPDHIRCFFRETLRLELSQFTDTITWHRLPFKRWLIGTFRKSINNRWIGTSSKEKIMAVKDVIHDMPSRDLLPLPGCNIIGPTGAGNEFGASIRGFIQGLLECGYPISIKEIPVDGQHGSVNPFRFISSAEEAMPYAINVFCCHPFFLNRIFSSAPSWLRLNNRLNVCIPDLPTHMIPESLIAHCSKMDCVLVANADLESVFRRTVQSLPVTQIAIPPYSHKQGCFQRVNFGIPEDSLLFTAYIDMQVSPQSQNSDYMINTFRKLESPTVLLALVCDSTSGMNQEYLHFLKNCIQGDTRIRMIEGMIGREDIQSLFACADFCINISPLYAPSPWSLEMMGNGKAVIVLDMPVHAHVINSNNALCVPVQYGEEVKGSSFKVIMPKEQSLYELLSRCCREPDTCKNAGKEASTGVAAIRDQYKTGGGANVFNQLIQRLDEKRTAIMRSRKKRVNNQLRVLFANRPDAFVHPGGDTRVMEQLKAALDNQGVTVEIATSWPDCVDKFDIIHVFNSTLSLYTDAFAARALSAGIPFVITALQEDIPRYHNRAIMTFNLMKEYVNLGQPSGFVDQGLESVRQQQQGTIITSSLALSQAAAVLVSGQEEAVVVKRYFPSARVQPGPFGFSLKTIDVNPNLFIQEYGVDDFVLCVGRLELRKNQLMLLKALENDDITIVFVGGGVNYHPAYVELCKRYKRKGTTLFLDRLDEAMLVSAFAAARVHCLPSWYELPGLVTIEAAAYGCPVVQSSWGTIGDYCGEFLVPCEPDDYTSIRTAVFKALTREKNPDAARHIREITWERAALKTLDAYHNALENGNNVTEPERPPGTRRQVQQILDPSKMMEEVIKLVECRKFSDAVSLYEMLRPHVVSVPELVKFDELMKKVKAQNR